jgi:hypothetical protein
VAKGKEFDRNPKKLNLVCGDHYLHCDKLQAVIGYDGRADEFKLECGHRIKSPNKYDRGEK